jgi:hypothetical protein
MPLTITVTASHTFPAGQPVTLAALRKAALPSISLTGSVATGDLVDGAVTPAKAAPGAYWYGAGTLAGDTYSVTLTPALTGLANGVWVRFRADLVNPAGGTKLDVNGLGAKSIFKCKGLALAQGDIRPNQECLVSYDATAAAWQLQSEVANHGDYYGSSTGAANAYVLTNDGTTQQTFVSLAQAAGKPLRFKANFTNTDAATLALDGLAAKAIRLWNDQALPNGYIKINQVLEVVYDSGLDHFLIPNPAKDTAIAGAVRNLVLKATAASGVDDDLTVTADEVVLKDTGGNAVSVSSFNQTMNPTGVNGANAFDTGSPTTGNWYYVWVIWDGTNARLLGSASATAPTMPTGYTHKGLVGEWYYETTTNPRGIITYGERKVFEMTDTGGIPALNTKRNFAHRLGRVPKWVQMRLVCGAAEFGYAVGDEIAQASVLASAAGTQFANVYADATNVTVVDGAAFTAANTPQIEDKTTPATIRNATAASWNYKVIAST